MDLARWQEIKEVVQAALDLPSEKREAYLSAIPDEELRREAEALLAVSETRAEAFENFQVLPPRQEEKVFLQEGDHVGQYAILGILGEGGMGTVYLAKDEKHARKVALKILSRRSIRASTDEHRILSQLTHPNIATLYDSGTTEEGLRYVAMEPVEGSTITAYCEKHASTLELRLKLFLKVCAAVGYAHRQFIAHRDLKPGNILVTSAGEPKLLDFGIAKLLLPENVARLTERDQRPLTVAFASPEQLSGEPTTAATDIYSLGVLLCVLLTGRLPYKVKGPHYLPAAIQGFEPCRPSDLIDGKDDEASPLEERLAEKPSFSSKQLKGDLDTIVLKALRKEPDQRYRFAHELAEDLQRHLSHEPVLARRGSRWYRTAKFLHRHRSGAIIAALMLLTLMAGAWVLLQQVRETRRERDRAETVADFLVGMFRVPNPWTRFGRSIPVTDVLDGTLAKVNDSQSPATRGTLSLSLGRIYLNLGLYTPAETLLVPALADLKRSHAEDKVVVEALTDLAIVEYHQGRYGQAEEYTRRALQRGSSERTTVLSLLGHVAFSMGEYARAERLFRNVLDRETKTYGGEHPAVARALNDLACSLHEQGRLTDALPLYERSLHIRQVALGENTEESLQSLYNLAHLYEDQGKPDAGENLLRRIVDLQRALGLYDPAHALLGQNRGSLLVSKRSYGEAEFELGSTLAMQRRLLPDEHPDIARSIEEIARLSRGLGRNKDAEAFFREGLARLDRALGAGHPDRITAANNLAALLAEEGRNREADALWRSLLEPAARHDIRPDIGRTVKDNLTSLKLRRREFRLLTFSRLMLTDPTRMQYSPQTSRSQAVAEANGSILFSDDFKENKIDAGKWEYSGNTVKTSEGMLRVETAVQDNGGLARTHPIEIDPHRPVIIERHAKVYAANSYFDGSMTIDVVGYPQQRFGVSYANYHYEKDGEHVTVGFSLFRHDANSHRFVDRMTNASELIPPIWGKWFDESLVFDPVTGEVRYSIDGVLHLTYNVGSLPPGAKSITLSFGTWGWYTGHYQWMDRLVVRQ